MYFARSRLLVLFLLIWLGGLVEVASAQHRYIFPQFAFGWGWESTLMVQASATPTTCTFLHRAAFSRCGSVRQRSLINFHTADLRNERVDDPKDSDPAEHGGLVWHGGS